MKILKRLIGIPLMIIALMILSVPFVVMWVLLGINKANNIVDKIMIPILELTE